MDAATFPLKKLRESGGRGWRYHGVSDKTRRDERRSSDMPTHVNSSNVYMASSMNMFGPIRDIVVSVCNRDPQTFLSVP